MSQSYCSVRCHFLTCKGSGNNLALGSFGTILKLAVVGRLILWPVQKLNNYVNVHIYCKCTCFLVKIFHRKEFPMFSCL